MAAGDSEVADLRRPAVSNVRVYVFTAFLAVVGVGLLQQTLGEGVLPRSPFAIPWWALAIAFAVAEVVEIDIEIRGETHSLTFTEIPCLVALAFASPEAYVLARLLGGLAGLAIVRRQSPQKLLFNLAMFLVETAAALIVYRALLGTHVPADPAGWLPAVAATATQFAISTMCVAVVITLYSGWPGRAWVQRVVGFGVGALLLSTVTGLITIGSLWRDARSGFLLVILASALPLIYRSYVKLSERYRNLTALHGFTALVGQSVELAAVGPAVLDGARQLLRAEHAGLVLLPVGADDVARRFASSNRESASDLVDVTEAVDEIKQLLPDGAARAVNPQDALPPWLSALSPKDILVAPLTADGALVGVLVVAGRLTDVNTFDADDLHLFETVANHASVALQKGRLVTQLQQEVAQRAHQALHDALTDLPNRVLLNEALTAEIDKAWRQSGRVGLLLVDLETFKEVNDTLGHETGDRLLLQVCERLQAFLPEEALLARFGGDEFAVLLPTVADSDEALSLAQRLHTCFEAPFVSEGVSLALGINVGVAVYPDHATDVTTMFQRADAATYAARLDRSGYELYSPERDPYTPRRLALAAELREAIEAYELDVYFQPKIHVATGIVRGAEALVRWDHPRLGPLSPDKFIPAAEHTGVIRPLTLYVVAQALEQCRTWRARGLELGVAVNLSARNLLDLQLVDDIAALIDQTGLAPASLTLELTESTVMSDSRRSLEILEGLHDLGVRLSVDDFGTGYSSLAHLRRLPVSEIKIDRSFVATMAVNQSDRSIVRSILELGRSLGLRTVAEGVENADAWELLREFNCEEAQGFFIARPLPIPQFDEWINGRPVGRLGTSERPVAVLEEYRRPISE
jgi:diguanylate cyclase (GGDEF)-like protein